ncbi:acyltransferase family protein [Roseibium sp.]|uniref:acyltransferase family protein n=1 Tax=Roseibium sp. TaxID=1936156 RepID=UPI003B504A22
MVLLYHVATRYQMSDLDPVATFFARFGAYGVDIFFPLSGYLITKSLLRDQSAPAIKVFFIRRFFRIVPLYFSALLFYIIVSVALQRGVDILPNMWINATFLTGWFMIFDWRDYIPYTITWSLSVEEFSYILLGVCALYVFRGYAALLAGFCIIAMLTRLYLFSEGYPEIHYFPLARLDSIAMGGIVAIAIKHNLPRKPVLWGLLGAFALACFLVQLGGLWQKVFFFVALPLFPCILIYVFEAYYKSWQPKYMSHYSLIGFYSYFIYLFHLFAIDGIMLVLGKAGIVSAPFWGVAFLAALATIVASIFSHAWFEAPLMRFGRKLERPTFGLRHRGGNA